MMSEKSDPLESGSLEARYVLMDEHGIQHGHADTYREACERREKLNLDRDLYVVREGRAVVPDGAEGYGLNGGDDR